MRSEKFQKRMRNITLDFETYFLLSYYFSTIDKTNIKNTENIHSIRHPYTTCCQFYKYNYHKR